MEPPPRYSVSMLKESPMGRIIRLCIVAIAVLCVARSPAQDFRTGIRRAEFAVPNPRGAQSLPYSTNDNEGNMWFVQPGGWLQSRGNMPLYQQGAMLTIHGA